MTLIYHLFVSMLIHWLIVYFFDLFFICVPDLIINALNTNWSLHLRYAQESRLLSRIVDEIIEKDYFNQNFTEEEFQNGESTSDHSSKGFHE